MSKTSRVDRQLAHYLLRIKAVELRPHHPFQWSSGLYAPIYCDNRKILSYPDIRQYVTEQLGAAVKQHFNSTPEVIAGVATSGIPFGTLLAHTLELPFIYVRSETKEHGKKRQIEGETADLHKVVVIEDLISTGKSCLNVVKTLQQAGFVVLGVLSLFTYQLPVATTNFEDRFVSYSALSSYESLIEEAIDQSYINAKDREVLEKWRENPDLWSQNQVAS